MLVRHSNWRVGSPSPIRLWLHDRLRLLRGRKGQHGSEERVGQEAVERQAQACEAQERGQEVDRCEAQAGEAQVNGEAQVHGEEVDGQAQAREAKERSQAQAGQAPQREALISALRVGRGASRAPLPLSANRRVLGSPPRELRASP